MGITAFHPPYGTPPARYAACGLAFLTIPPGFLPPGPPPPRSPPCLHASAPSVIRLATAPVRTNTSNFQPKNQPHPTIPCPHPPHDLQRPAVAENHRHAHNPVVSPNSRPPTRPAPGHRSPEPATHATLANFRGPASGGAGNFRG